MDQLFKCRFIKSHPIDDAFECLASALFSNPSNKVMSQNSAPEAPTNCHTLQDLLHGQINLPLLSRHDRGQKQDVGQIAKRSFESGRRQFKVILHLDSKPSLLHANRTGGGNCQPVRIRKGLQSRNQHWIEGIQWGWQRRNAEPRQPFLILRNRKKVQCRCQQFRRVVFRLRQRIAPTEVSCGNRLPRGPNGIEAQINLGSSSSSPLAAPKRNSSNQQHQRPDRKHKHPRLPARRPLR